jgi:predicted AlkP superfamily pyrophosphatase or phosphodiesterase
MQRVVLPITVLVLAILLGACSMAPPRPVTGLRLSSHPIPEVILISIDGYRADYLARGENPVLAKLAAHGVHARWLIPSFPTVTEPNHYTFLTGLYPDQHGIVDNDIADRQIQPKDFEMAHYSTMVNPRWWSDATPLWLSVQRDGMRTGEVSWPSGQIRIDGARPDLHLNGQQAGTPVQETAEVLRWLDLPSNQRPHFIMLHYETVDSVGHHYGPISPQMDAALREVDGAIGRLVEGLRSDGQYADTDLVVVSDHGMAQLAPGHEIYLDDIINRRAVSLVTLGAMAGVDPHRGFAGNEAATDLLGPHSHMHCWRKQDLPSHLHYGHNPRVPQIVCLAPPGWVITTHWAVKHRGYVLRGVHGYDNTAPSMRALFIAEGPSFREGIEVPPFPNVDVYSLLAHILGVKPERNAASFSRMASLLKPTDGRYVMRHAVDGNRRARS